MASTCFNVRSLRFGDVTPSFRVKYPRKEILVPALDTAIDEHALAVGLRIRGLRRARRLTLVQLAAEAGLSHSFLSQLERGLARPSIVSLQRIAFALGSSQVELLGGPDDDAIRDQPPTALVRAGEGRHGAYGTAAARMLTTGVRKFQPMEIVGSNAEPGGFHRHAEDEFVHVLAGSVGVDLGEDEHHDLRPGDSLYYVGGTPHRWHARDGGDYRLLVVKERPENL